MKIFLAISLLVAFSAIAFGRVITPSVFSREEQIGNKFHVKWTVDKQAKTVNFQVTAETAGWVGFGISKSGGMLGADLIMGGKDGQTTYFDDRFSKSAVATPVIDTQQDWILEDLTENSGVTTLKFWRKFDTGDTTQDIKIQDEEVLFIWAFGTTDKIGYHVGDRGVFPVNILQEA